MIEPGEIRHHFLIVSRRLVEFDAVTGILRERRELGYNRGIILAPVIPRKLIQRQGRDGY
jgi:hypothetical protein